MSREEARLRARELVKQSPATCGLLATFGPATVPSRVARRPPAERVVGYLLSRGRRLEILEPLLATNFKSDDVLCRRQTNLSKVLWAQFMRMADLGPLFFFDREGAEELYELFTWARGVADGVVQRHSSAEWLLLLRRAFLAPADGNRMAPSWFTEAFIRRSVAPTTHAGLIGRTWRASPRTLEDVHDLLLITTVMWNVGRAFRTLSKGLVVSFTRPPTFYPVAFQNDEVVWNAIAMLEHRQALWQDTSLGNVLHGAGVLGRAFAPEGGEFRPGGAIPAWREVGSRLDRDRYFLCWRTHHWPEFIDPDSVFGLNAGLTPSLRSLAAAGALWASWKDIGLDKAKFLLPNGPWLGWGLHRLQRTTLISSLQAWQEVAYRYDPGWKAELGLEDLCRPSVELQWIDDGYALVLDFSVDEVLVDLVGASRALHSGHVRASGGAEANRLTALFEKQVQTIIDASSYRPEGLLRELIGKTIRIGGRSVTDIDAVADGPDLLILVDAKSWSVPPSLQFGEYFAVEDRRKVAEAACIHWQEKVAIIREHRRELGLPDGKKIVGVVVCPEAPYVLGGPCTADIGLSLMALSSIAELEFCLMTASAPSGRPPSAPEELTLRKVLVGLGGRLLPGARRWAK